MYALLSIFLFFVGVALIAVVLIRKMPALVVLPEEPIEGSKPNMFARTYFWLAKVDWEKWRRRVGIVLAKALDVLRRFFIWLARESDQLTKVLQHRVRHLSGEVTQYKTFPFSARIRRRSAFLEEERRLIEQLAQNPQDTDAYRRLGNLYMIAGNAADARAAFNEVLRLVPEDEEASRRLEELVEGGEKTVAQ